MDQNSQILEIKINNFKSKYLAKQTPFIYEPNKFDIFVDELINLLNYAYSKYLKIILIYIFKSMRKFLITLTNLITNIDTLEKKIENQEKVISENLRINNQLADQIIEIHGKLDIFLKNSKENKFKNKQELEEVESNSGKDRINIRTDNYNNNQKIEFFQEENVRLSNELSETKKKFEITKDEIKKFENQRSNLISKINSVNDVIKDTNVLTNVFENQVKENKINIVDHNKIETKKIANLDFEVSKIFSKS